MIGVLIFMLDVALVGIGVGAVLTLITPPIALPVLGLGGIAYYIYHKRKNRSKEESKKQKSKSDSTIKEDATLNKVPNDEGSSQEPFPYIEPSAYIEYLIKLHARILSLKNLYTKKSSEKELKELELKFNKLYSDLSGRAITFESSQDQDLKNLLQFLDQYKKLAKKYLRSELSKREANLFEDIKFDRFGFKIYINGHMLRTNSEFFWKLSAQLDFARKEEMKNQVKKNDERIEELQKHFKANGKKIDELEKNRKKQETTIEKQKSILNMMAKRTVCLENHQEEQKHAKKIDERIEANGNKIQLLEEQIQRLQETLAVLWQKQRQKEENKLKLSNEERGVPSALFSSIPHTQIWCADQQKESTIIPQNI